MYGTDGLAIEPISQFVAAVVLCFGSLLGYLGWMKFLDRNHKSK